MLFCGMFFCFFTMQFRFHFIIFWPLAASQRCRFIFVPWLGRLAAKFCRRVFAKDWCGVPSSRAKKALVDICDSTLQAFEDLQVVNASCLAQRSLAKRRHPGASFCHAFANPSRRRTAREDFKLLLEDIANLQGFSRELALVLSGLGSKDVSYSDAWI